MFDSHVLPQLVIALAVRLDRGEFMATMQLLIVAAALMVVV